MTEKPTFTRRCVGMVAVLLLAGAPAFADDDDGERATPADDAAEKISLAKLIKIAVQQSSTLAFARGNLAKAELDGVIAGAPDQVVLSGGVELRRKAEDRIPNAQAQVVGENALETTLGVSKRISTGGSMALTLQNTQQTRRYGEAPDMPATANISVASIGLAQPLLRGLFMGAKVNERKAELAQSEATLQALDAGARIVRQLVIAYWELAFARQSLAVREASLALAREQADLAKKLTDRGVIPDNALKAAQYGLAVREEAVLRARRDLELESIALRKLAGLELAPDQIGLEPTDTLVVEKPRQYDEQKILEQALAKSPLIAASKIGLDLANVVLDERKNATLPALDLSLSAGGVGVGSDVGTSIGKIGSSYQVIAGVGLRWEIGGAARASEDRARIDRTNAKRNAKDIERDVIAAVVTAVHDVRGAQQRIDVSRRAIDLASANLATEQSLFKADKSNAVLVFQRQTELEEARLLEARAGVDYQIAVTNLEYLTGKLLDRYGVELAEKSSR